MVCDRGTRGGGGGGGEVCDAGQGGFATISCCIERFMAPFKVKANMLGIFLADGTRAAMVVGQGYREDSVMG